MALDPARSFLLRWGEGEPPAELLRSLGIEAVLVSSGTALPAKIEGGLWPGIARPAVRGGGEEVASASREPWVNANGFRIHCHRAAHPGTPPLLDYLPDASGGLSEGQVVPFETLEIALAEARVNGGNAVLNLDPRYRKALLESDAKALTAWKSLGRTAQWLDANASLFGKPPLPIITALHDGSDTTEEFANMLFRRGASPRVVSAQKIPPPDPQRIIAVSAAGLKQIPDALLAHARAGSTVIIDAKPSPTWKKVKPEQDRDFYELGKGQVLVYHDTVDDPSEYALDVIDVVNYRRRAARVWNANATIPLATEGANASEILLCVLNYGSPVQQEVQARVQGHYSKAALLRPESAPTDLKIYRRGTTTEVFLPSLGTVAVVRFLR